MINNTNITFDFLLMNETNGDEIIYLQLNQALIFENLKILNCFATGQ